VSPAGDKSITCRDCGQDFEFSAGEQAFYATRGLSEPSRCPSCRAARKASRESSGGGYSGGGGYDRSSSYGGSSSSYDRGSSYGSRGSGSGGSRGGGQTRQMFQVTCDDCGTVTEVPFEPRAGRPVYCRSCYERRKG
jgi:CxxC-x17-CxxC domain-containing protein